MSLSIASTYFNQNGATSEEMWDLVVLLNRELRSTRLKLESSLLDVKRLQGENEELSARVREKSEQLTHCAAGSCKSADEVNTLKQAKKDLESALVKSQTTCTERSYSIVSLKADLEDMHQQKKIYKLRITTLQNEVSKLKDDLSSHTRQPAGADASNDNPRFIPAELLPALIRFPPPDISDRPKTSRPCALYRPKETPGISLAYQHAFLLVPSQLYDALDENPWRRNHRLSKVENQRHEVLYSIASSTGQIEVHYAGTYECQRFGRLSSSEYMQCSLKLREELCEKTVVSSLTFDQSTASVNNAYEDGTQEISVLFLRCVGFNYHLYCTLRDGFKEETGKRPAATEGLVSRMRMKKKARMEGSRGV